MTSDGARDWSAGIAGRVVRLAARRTPDTLSERLSEEWLADLMQHRGRIARGRFAVGCCWAAIVIVHDTGSFAATPVANAAVVPGSWIRFQTDDPSPFTGSVSFLLIAVLQMGLICGAAMGLGR